jgi:hypothetical protein
MRRGAGQHRFVRCHAAQQRKGIDASNRQRQRRPHRVVRKRADLSAPDSSGMTPSPLGSRQVATIGPVDQVITSPVTGCLGTLVQMVHALPREEYAP